MFFNDETLEEVPKVSEVSVSENRCSCVTVVWKVLLEPICNANLQWLSRVSGHSLQICSSVDSPQGHFSAGNIIRW